MVSLYIYMKTWKGCLPFLFHVFVDCFNNPGGVSQCPPSAWRTGKCPIFYPAHSCKHILLQGKTTNLQDKVKKMSFWFNRRFWSAPKEGGFCQPLNYRRSNLGRTPKGFHRCIHGCVHYINHWSASAGQGASVHDLVCVFRCSITCRGTTTCSK